MSIGNTFLSLRRTRYGLLILLWTSLFVLHGLQRLCFLWIFSPPGTNFGTVVKTIGIGLVMDGFVALVASLPLAAWFLVIPNRWFAARWHQLLLSVGFLLFWGVAFFLLLADGFFFDEFKSRFNTVAVDYLIYPHEVFSSLWDLYPMGWILTGCALMSVAWLWASRRFLPEVWRSPAPLWQRALVFGGLLMIAIATYPFVGNSLTRFSQERQINEIAGNGWYSGIQAALTRELEYEPFYRVMTSAQAFERARRLLDEPQAKWTDDRASLRRHIAGDTTRPRLNVIILLEESLGSEFFGCLGRAGASLTPNLDEWVSREGMLFSNLYATGNRTVRGMEGVLCSFPPMPGDSVVVRARQCRIETIASVLKRDGYATTFVYGGRGIFDHMRPFLTANGYDRFIERKDFEHPTFETIWGVCNEDLYQRCIDECRKMNQEGKPFLLTALSVSNHKPFTYPKGRIPENPDERRRDYAVKYTDYALGKFLEQIKREPFYQNTIVAIVADHGARVYGRQTIPMKSYEIPLLVFGPAVVNKPSVVGTLGCQLDVAPTLLGMIGRPYDSTFFGRDLLRLEPGQGRALLNHNRDIGLYRQQRMVVLGLNKTVEYFHGNPKSGNPAKVLHPDELDKEVMQDAIALFQVASELYQRGQYCIEPAPQTFASKLNSGVDKTR